MRLMVVGLLLYGYVFAGPPEPSAADVLRERCVKCHSGAKAAGKLDLSSYEGTMRPTKRGGMVVNGDANKSRLVRAMLGVDEEIGQMPNQDNPLSWREIFAVKRWINAGASKQGFTEKFQMVSMSGK